MKSFKHPRGTDLTLESVLSALGDPIRLAMVRRLAVCPSSHINCTSVAEQLEKLAPSTRSHHLRILREAGLILSERKGVEVMNRLRQTELDERFPGLLKTILSQHA